LAVGAAGNKNRYLPALYFSVMDTEHRQTVPVKFSRVWLSPDGSLGDTCRRVFQNCLQQVLDNRVGVISGTHPECVHQMRVGIRRFRVAVRLFAPWVRFPRSLERDLRWLSAELGKARDMDVIAAHTLPELLRECPEETGLAALRIRAVALARRRRRLAAKTAASARCSVLLDSLQHWVKTVAARPSLAVPPGQPMVDILVRVHTRLVSRARHLVAGTSEERHAVRIAAKRARYAADFFRSLLNERDVERYLSVLAKLQSVLGALNDFTVAEPILVELSRGHGRMLTAAGFARGYLFASAKGRVRKPRRLQHKIERLQLPGKPSTSRQRQRSG
jgi:CHAD domain-containing protein